MTFSRSVSFSHHSDNLAEVKSTLVQLQRFHKAEIRRTGSARTPAKPQPSVQAIRRVHLLVIGIMAEATLKKVIADPTGFEDSERKIIWSQSNQELQWKKTIDLAFRRHYNLAAEKSLDESSLGCGPASQRQMLFDIISKQLQPVITDRNKIAHANWVWQLKSMSNDEFIRNPRDHSMFNYCMIESLRAAIQALGELVYVLAVSEPTFQRDYDRQISLIEKSIREAGDSEAAYERMCNFLDTSRRVQP